jgi:hypothetical protein
MAGPSSYWDGTQWRLYVDPNAPVEPGIRVTPVPPTVHLARVLALAFSGLSVMAFGFWVILSVYLLVVNVSKYLRGVSGAGSLGSIVVLGMYLVMAVAFALFWWWVYNAASELTDMRTRPRNIVVATSTIAVFIYILCVNYYVTQSRQSIYPQFKAEIVSIFLGLAVYHGIILYCLAIDPWARQGFHRKKHSAHRQFSHAQIYVGSIVNLALIGGVVYCAALAGSALAQSSY